MTHAPRARIIGGGIGGMAAAVTLRQRGVAADLIDSDPDWRVYGAAITVTGPTLRAFKGRGLLDAIREQGHFAAGQRLFRSDGTLIGERSPPTIAPGLPSPGGIMHRRLHHILSADALMLGEKLAVAAFDVPAALAAFTKRRFERRRFVVERSTAIGRRQLEQAPADEPGMRIGQAMGFSGRSHLMIAFPMRWADAAMPTLPERT